ncbi:hypothetical protein D0864_09786 [Hortaea werneckii]|uniref:Uncharacterized protein n=1 Tax=Hortaea werneckii TaxID=91943 RepID=A0A3M7EGF5_HORWE|nr:hypothetical protein D0864_09786 [Hortaea werneckii]
MAEANDDNALFAIEVDVDDYANTAAADNPSASTTSTNQDDAATVSRTFQSASAFQAQKAAYRAKIDWGDLETELTKAVPALCRTTRDPVAGGEKVKLSKKEIQLLGVLVGCELDAKTRVGVEKWIARSKGRLGDV